MTISDRIELIINTFCKGNKSAFAREIGVIPSLVGKYYGKQEK